MRAIASSVALLAVAAASVSAQSTCNNATLEFITASTGPFALTCAPAVTAAVLGPFSATISLTTLLDPSSSVATFLVADPVKQAINGALNAAIKAQTGVFNLTTLGLPSYPYADTNPNGFNYTKLKEQIAPFVGGDIAAAGLMSLYNSTVLGTQAYVLCPALKNITQSLIGCVPSACSGLALGLCQTPTAAGAAALMGAYADKPFTLGTLSILGSIGAACDGATKWYLAAKNGLISSSTVSTAVYNTLQMSQFPDASAFNVSCSVLANPALAGTYQYAATKSPTVKSAGVVAGLGLVAGVMSAVAAVALL